MKKKGKNWASNRCSGLTDCGEEEDGVRSLGFGGMGEAGNIITAGTMGFVSGNLLLTRPF